MNDPDAIEALLEDAPEVMTTEELADLLKVKPATVARWSRDFGLKSVSIGFRLKRFTKKNVREFLAHSDELSDSTTGEVSDG